MTIKYKKWDYEVGGEIYDDDDDIDGDDHDSNHYDGDGHLTMMVFEML